MYENYFTNLQIDRPFCKGGGGDIHIDGKL